MSDMADDQVLADLQRLTGTSSGASVDSLLEQLEALAKDHEEHIDTIVREYYAKRAALEAQIAARSSESDQAAREAQIAHIKAGLQPTAQT